MTGACPSPFPVLESRVRGLYVICTHHFGQKEGTRGGQLMYRPLFCCTAASPRQASRGDKMRPDLTVPRGYVGEATVLASEFHCRDFAHEELISVGEERTSQQWCVRAFTYWYNIHTLPHDTPHHNVAPTERTMMMVMRMMDVYVQEGTSSSRGCFLRRVHRGTNRFN